MLICHDLFSDTGCGASNADTAQFCCSCGRELSSLLFPMRLHNPDAHIRHYRIARIIGYGGFGAVYAAHDENNNDQLVALKETFNPESIRGFQREYDILHLQQHYGLPDYHAIFQEQNKGYLVMEFIPGENLEEVMATHNAPLDEKEAIHYAEQICTILSYLHEKDILHRDIKPPNIRRTPKGQIKLVDFGLVRFGSKKTASSQRGVGTMGYSPIEQHSSGTGPYSDIYSLGATLYHLLTNTHPLSALDRVASSVDPLPPLRQFNPNVSQHIADVIAQAMAIQKEHRFPSAEAMKRALLAITPNSSSAQPYVQTAQRTPPPYVQTAQRTPPPYVQTAQRTPQPYVQTAIRATPPMWRTITALPTIETPDATDVSSVAELVQWCEQHWEEAADWLYGSMSGVIQTRWGFKEIAEEMNALVKTHNQDHNDGLDALLCFFDPHGFAQEPTHLIANPSHLDYGELAVDGQSKQEVEFQNTGRRYLHAQLDLPPGLTASIATFSLIPRCTIKPTFTLNMQHAGGANVRSTMNVTQNSALLLQLAVQADVQVQASDGTLLTSPAELAIWCEQHWDEAAAWLYDTLPTHVERVWGKVKLARDMQAIVKQHAQDRNAGLDALLRLLDPQMDTPNIHVSPTTLDFGTLNLEQTQKKLTLTCAGRGYAVLTVQGERWLTPTAKTLALRAGQTTQLTVTATMAEQPIGTYQATLTIRSHHGQTWQVTASATSIFLTATLRQRFNYLRTEYVMLTDLYLPQLTDIEQQFRAAKTLADGQRVIQQLEQVETAVTQASDLKQMVLTGHTEYVGSVAFSPDGRLLASGSSDNTVRLWDVASGKERAVLTGHSSYVYSIAFSPDGRLLASGSWDKTVRLWEVASSKERAVLTGHTSYVDSVAFSPDGRVLASGSWDKTVRLWDVASGKERAVLTGHSRSVHSVAFSPDGRLLASGSLDHTVRLWEVASGKERAVLTGHTNWVWAIAFSPDGRLLASGSWDNTVRLWSLVWRKSDWEEWQREEQERIREEQERKQRREQERKQREEQEREEQERKQRREQEREEQIQRWRAEGKCEVCGTPLGVWDKLRGIARCKQHR